MNVRIKLFFCFLLVGALVVIAGNVSSFISQRTLEKTIGENLVFVTHEVLDSIDRDLLGRINEWTAYSKNMHLQNVLEESNKTFQMLDNPQKYIDKENRAWTAAGESEITPFMNNLITNPVSMDLKRRIGYYENVYGYKVFGEIFVTNKYGANVVQTGKTSDYEQGDEAWWAGAKKDGLYIGDITYDKSADVYSIDIGIRVDDQLGMFLGVMKVVFNLKEVISIIEQAKNKSNYSTTESMLINKNGRVIYSSKTHSVLDNILQSGLFRNIQEEQGYFIASPDVLGEIEKLFTYAHSDKGGHIKSLGWVLITEQETREIFSPVAKMKNITLFSTIGVMIIAILLGFAVSHSITQPLVHLRNAIDKVAKGDLKVEINVDSNDEFGSLAHSFNNMVTELRRSREGFK
ncbi:MAG: HAMP domain-containing protein [Candidatus Omnitrophota bacterium]